MTQTLVLPQTPGSVLQGSTPQPPPCACLYSQDFQAAEKLTDVSAGAWVSDAAGRVRQVSYTKPLNIPLPLAPKQCKVGDVTQRRRLLQMAQMLYVTQPICGTGRM